jgi:hypothetical protein
VQKTIVLKTGIESIMAGNVAWLKDDGTGSKWDYQGKDQCLEGTIYGSS